MNAAFIAFTQIHQLPQSSAAFALRDALDRLLKGRDSNALVILPRALGAFLQNA